MLNAHDQMILDEYKAHINGFDKMEKFAEQSINEMLASIGLIVTAVSGRVKTEGSLAGKLELKGYKYSSLADITDIIGLRIIALFPEDVDKIASLIEKRFSVDWENSVDKRQALDADQFGYLSLHYICSIPKTEYTDPDDADINNYKMEVQIRTTLQHAWAQINHDIGYKSAIGIPKEYARKFSRLAGLLEVADDQFSQIATEVEEYRRKVGSLVKDGKFEDLSLDLDSFHGYIGIDPFKQLNDKIASINRAEIEHQSFEPYYEVFHNFGFETLADIEEMKEKYDNDAYRLAVLQISGTDLDILAETIGVQNLCIVKILEEGGGEEGIVKFLDTIRGKKERNIKIAQNYVAKAKTIDLI